MAQRDSGILCMASNTTGQFTTYFTWDDVSNEIVRFKWDNTTNRTGRLSLTRSSDGVMQTFDFQPGTGQSVNTTGMGYSHAVTDRGRHYVQGYAVGCTLA